MFPSECVLERHVRRDGAEDLAASNLPLFILECKDRKADGYADDQLELYNQRLQDMVIGVRLADAPPALSYLAILGGGPFAEILAVDKTVIVIRLDYPADANPSSYLIYDAVALSLRMIPAPEFASWTYTLSYHVSIVARPCQQGGDDYALVHTMNLVGAYHEESGAYDAGNSLVLWRPSLSSQPWSPSSDYKYASFPDGIDWSVDQRTDTEFSFNGHAYWVNLLCGVSYCSCDAVLVDDMSGVVEFRYIPLPVQPGGHHRYAQRMAQPAAYRTMGVVRDSFIRFVSINGFQDYVELKKRTVTVWKLLGHGEGWEKEHELRLKTLWGFQGFGDMSKDLSPMYPLLSTNDPDLVYLVLGEYREDRFNFKFIPSEMRHLLAVDMRKKIVTSVPLAHLRFFPDPLISCGISRHLRKALVGPCNDEGIPMMKEARSQSHPHEEEANYSRRRNRRRCC